MAVSVQAAEKVRENCFLCDAFFCIRALTHSKGGLHFALFAVKKDNTAIYITQVAAAKLTKLCEITYEVAQIIGNVPVIISVC